MEHSNRHSMHPIGPSITIMVLASIVIGYYLTMTIILRENKTDNLNKLYQALLMGFWMGLVEFLMIAYFAHLNLVTYLPLLVFLFAGIALFTYLIYTQTGINENQFMLGMIEHHQMMIDTIAVVKPKIQDPRLLRLTNDIVESQSREITEVRNILDERGVPNDIRSLLY